MTVGKLDLRNMKSILFVCCALPLVAVCRPSPDAPVFNDDYGDGGAGYLGGGGGGHGGGIVLLGGGGNHGGGGYSGGGGGYGGGGGGFGQTAAVVQKHIYVHVPPPEPEVAAPVPVVAPGPPKKHYKIVFIKAPSSPTQAAPVLPAPQQDQEKTLIYVLHKHPADAAPIVLPSPQPTAPSKPEVYFIRYKTQKQLQQAGFSSTLAPHYSSTFAPVSSTLGHSHSTVSFRPTITTAGYH